MTKWLRFRDIQARGIFNNRVTLERWIKKYGFPPGHMLGPNTRAWTDEEIARWESSRPSATQHDGEA